MNRFDLENRRKTRVESIGLSDRLTKLLLKNNIRSVGGIISRSEKELRRMLKASYEEVGHIFEKIKALEPTNEELPTHPAETPNIVPETEKAVALLAELSKFDSEDEDIVDYLSSRLGYKKWQIVAHTRTADIVRVRDLIIYLLREYGGLSYPAIGRLIDRDHTTIIHAHTKIKKKFKENPHQENELLELISKVKSIRDRKTLIETDVIPSILASVEAEKRVKRSVFKEIPPRNLKILELYREGLTLESIAKVFKLTRERVRQVAFSTIRQQAINESISRGIVVDSDVVVEEEAKRRRAVQESRRPKKTIKKEKEIRWSRFYLACKSCGTTTIPHVKNGYCEKCLGVVRGKRRDEIIEQHQNKCDMCGVSRGEAVRQYGRDFYITKTHQVLCKKDFLDSTGKKLVESRWKTS